MRRTAILMALSLVCLFTDGQTQHFYTSDRMTSNLITSICQDEVGYIWVGTEFGLNKSDGYRFTNYIFDSNNPASISSNNICALLKDHKGNLWIGTARGVCYYNDANDEFERISLPDAPRARVNDMIQEDDDHLLLGTAGYGLYRLDVNTHEAVAITGYAREDSSYFSHIFIDRSGNFWKAGSDKRVSYRLNDQQHTIRTYESPFGTVTSFVDYDGGVLMVCQNGLVYYRDGQFKTDYIDTSSIGSGSVLLRTAISDGQGNVFIGTMGNGLCHIPRGTHRLERYEYTTSSFDLTTSNVWALYEDSHENLWVGCLNRGILLLPQRAPQFSTWKFSTQNVSVGGSVTSICPGDDDMIWCTVQNNGVYGFDSHGRVVANPPSPCNTYAIYRDKSSRYWIGTSDGLYNYLPEKGTYQKEFGFASNYINTMADDGKGHLFLSTFAKGFCIYDLQTHELRHHSMHQKDSVRGRLHNDWIMSLLVDSRGMLWIGTSSNLCCYDPVNDTFHPYGWEVLMEGKTINTLYEDSRHRILLGTDAGMYLYDPQKEDVIPYPGAEALANKAINGIVEDRYGDLWCSTTMGIWQYQHDQQQFVAYVNGNGLTSREYVRNVGMHTADDRIYFAVCDGITSFDPSALRETHHKPGTVHLTGLFIGETAVNCNTLSDGKHVTTTALTQSDHFTLSYLDNTFSMEFSLLTTYAENISFEYRINGAHEWTNTGAGNNVVAFHHLQPGSYTIEVRAYDNGVYTDSQVYRIVVRAPWYRSTLAYLIYICMALVTAGGGLWLYIRRRRQELNEEKMKFLINATHDIRSPLTLIMSPLHKLMKRNDLGGEVQTELKTIENNAQRIQNLVNQILDIRKIDKQQMKVQCQETDMVQYVGNLLKSYEYTARERNIAFRYEPALDKLPVWLDRKHFEKVIDNLLSNAFKYTYDGGEIKVRVSESRGQTAELQVIDNGMGIKGDAKKLFDRFYQGSASRSVHIDGTGIGLNLCKMVVEMHHGTIEAANRNDMQGSVFTVRLPLGYSHLEKEEILIQEEKANRPRSQSNYRVMVVDDDVEIGNYILSELGSYYHITPVTSAREALRLLLSDESEKQYDVVVSDVMMPEMDGFTMLRLIKTNMNISHIPVVMLTSKSDVANRLEGLEKGADAFLAKPFDMDELHVVINNLINKNLRLKGKFSGTQQQKDKIEEKKVKGNDELLMERVMKVVNDHLSDSDFNVELLTTEVGISRAQLHRKMKEITGLPVSEFIRNLRLEQAVRLLEEQKINVTQVAYTVGFSNLAHFSTVFRKQFGVSPTEYIERKKGK